MLKNKEQKRNSSAKERAIFFSTSQNPPQVGMSTNVVMCAVLCVELEGLEISSLFLKVISTEEVKEMC